MSSIRSHHFHSSNRRNHSTASRGSQESNRISNCSQNSVLQQNKLKGLTKHSGHSVSCDNVSQTSNSTNNSLRSFKYQISPKESNAQLHMLHSVNNCALSLIVDVDRSNSLLRQAIETNARRKLLRHNTDDSAVSLPQGEGKVCLHGSDSSKTGSQNSINSGEKSS